MAAPSGGTDCEATCAADPLLDDPCAWTVDHMVPRLREWLRALEGVVIERAATEYEGFGSFHSENVEDAIALSEAEYRPPRVPSFAGRVLGLSELREVDDARGDAERVGAIVLRRAPRCSFGAAFCEQHFTLTPDFVFVNHGAFGGALRGALDMKHRFERLMESQVVEFVDRVLLPLVVYSVRRLAGFVHASPRQVVLVANATLALNAAMCVVAKDDVVAYFDSEYLSVYKMLYFRCRDVGASLHEVPLLRHLRDPGVMGDDAALVRALCAGLPDGCTVVVFDHITSGSALCLPAFTHLIPALRGRGVAKIIVDGAHAPLQVALDFNGLRHDALPTVYIGNLHKWCCLPKSAGFMWVHEDWVGSIHPTVLSHGAGDGLLSEFIWDGARDYSSYLCVPAVLDFWCAQGLERVRAYCAGLLRRAVAMLSCRFGTAPVARHAPFMALVELPEALQGPSVTARFLQDVLHDVYKVEVPVKCVEGRLYVRVSAFVYNEPSDYVYLCEAVLGLAQRLGHTPMRACDVAADSEAAVC
ncbi:hypothetical protein ERJ75_001192800 [Trypanosoma vivax]|nr:hypothetical protein ERJ75_001192800 [Trypanosoma vivax]